MKAWSIVSLLSSCLFSVMAPAATTNTISQWGITWQFSAMYEYGTFANGDYWVVGPITVTNMTPAWDGTNNGWEINPTVQSAQGFTATAGASYNASLRPALPFTVTNGSLVKTIGGINVSSSSVIKSAAVLTVLTNAPHMEGTNYFRPPYVGTNKPLYLVSDLRRDLVPRYRAVSSAPTLSSIVSNFSKCLRMDHNLTLPRRFRPSGAMKDYQPQNTPELNEAMLRLMLDDSYETKLPALIQFTQHTIDQAYAVLLGYRRLDDGHNPNHRVLAAWAATLLDIREVRELLATTSGFHEDIYLKEGLNGPLFGEDATVSMYWNYIMGKGGGRSNKDPYGYIDGGSLSSGVASYQNITSQSLKGQALVFRLFPQLRDCIPSSRFITLSGYAERWVTNGTWALPDPAAPYDGSTNNYGITFGPDGQGGFIHGTGRFPAAHGAYKDAGQYKSAFVAIMWDAYAKLGSVPRPPSRLLRVTHE